MPIKLITTTFKRIQSTSAAYLILAIGIAFSVVVWGVASHILERQERAEFRYRVSQIKDSIEQESQNYLQPLYGLKGLFAASDTVRRDSFRRYMSAFSLEQNYPAFQAVAFARFVPATLKNRFVGRHKSGSLDLDITGNPDPALTAASERNDYLIIDYIEPLDRNVNILGFDLLSDRGLSSAISLARDTGEVAGVNAATFFQKDSEGTKLIFFVPVYRSESQNQTLEQRRSAFVGTVVGILKINRILNNIVDRQTREKIRVRFYDLGLSQSGRGAKLNGSLVYDSGGKNISKKSNLQQALLEQPHYAERVDFKIGNHYWAVFASSESGFVSKTEQATPLIVFAGGLVTTALLFALIWSTATSRNRALALAHSMTEGLRESEERFRVIAETVPIPLVLATFPEGDVLLFNGGAASFFDIPIANAPGKKLTDFFEDPEECTSLIGILQQTGHVADFETKLRTATGKLAWVTISAQTTTIKGETVLLVAINDITERKQAEERISYLAHHDGLTGLPNRNLLQDRLQQAIARANRTGKRVGLLFVDLDRFKTVNDSLGHQMGDNLLQEVSDRLIKCIREEDTVARQGGDEFVVILPDINDARDAGRVAQKILDVLPQPFNIEEHELYVTPSIGISIYPDDGKDVKALMMNADTAMFQAKESGRNNYRFFTAQMNVKAHERLTMENSLRRAWRQEELVLLYQPQLSICSGEIIGVEALIRWQHPERGMIEPADFIPLAEETGLILPIGEWVMMQACLQNKMWHNQGFDRLRVAVNLSARQFRQPNLLKTVSRTLAKTGLRPDCLELELTESSIMHFTEESISTLTRLSEMRVQLSIDDFGTGYSSLSYLKRFPIHKLKIDGSFVRDITTDPDDAAIITAIIAMAKNLKLTVIAEGVETVEQLSFLQRHGCDQAQGYLLGEPMSSDQISELLKEEHNKLLVKS